MSRVKVASLVNGDHQHTHNFNMHGISMVETNVLLLVDARYWELCYCQLCKFGYIRELLDILIDLAKENRFV